MIALTPSPLTSSLTSLLVKMQMNKHHVSAAPQALLLSGGHFVPRWLPIGSRRRPLACCCCCCCWMGLWVTTGPMPEGLGGVSLPSLQLAGSKPEYSRKQQSWTQLDRTGLNYSVLQQIGQDLIGGKCRAQRFQSWKDKKKSMDLLVYIK